MSRTLEQSRADFAEAVNAARNDDKQPAAKLLRRIRTAFGQEVADRAKAELLAFIRRGGNPKW